MQQKKSKVLILSSLIVGVVVIAAILRYTTKPIEPSAQSAATSTTSVITQDSVDAYLLYKVMHAPDDSPKPIGVLPTRVGSCVTTQVESTSTRLTDALTNLPIANSGSAINYTDGGYQVSYDNESGIENSNVGDKIRLCLTYIPTDCPPGDDRGKIYKTTNLRTGVEWELPDAEHECGGA